jgi:hypothetical protein
VRNGAYWHVASLGVLLIILGGQLALAWSHATKTMVPVGDEYDYYDRAMYLVQHGEFRPFSEIDRQIVDGEVFGYGNFRPPGYPVILALTGLDAPTFLQLRRRMVVIQSFAIALVVICLYVGISAMIGDPRWLLAVSVVLGVQPWCFEFSSFLITESLTASLCGLALIGLALFVVQENRGRSILWFAAAVALFSLSFMLRPEMIVLVPALVIFAIILRTRQPQEVTILSLVALMIFLMFVAANVAYRIQIEGRPAIFGEFVHRAPGLHEWSKTWIGTQKLRHAAVYDGYKGAFDPERLPDRAFADDTERRHILSAYQRLQDSKEYDEEVDNAFQIMARKRMSDSWLMNVVAVRLWNVGNLWLNLETNSQLLDFLSLFSPTLRKALLACLLVLKIGLVFGAISAIPMLHRNLKERPPIWCDYLTMLALVFIVVRSLLIGVIIGEYLHRYMTPAWPALLWCSVYSYASALARLGGQRSVTTSTLASR